MILLFLAVMAVRLLCAPDPRPGLPYLIGLLSCFVLLPLTLFVYRRFFQTRRWAQPVYYLVLILFAAIPYSWLQKMIPILHPGEVDEPLRQIDLWFLGVDVSVWMERFATPFTSAWFGAVYFGYYPAVAAMVLYLVFFCQQEERLLEFGWIILGTCLVAFILYSIFPALGPYHHLADRFAGPLPEKTVVPFVHSLIQNGPLRDVFPSMHTALPFGILLFSARYYPRIALATGIWFPQIVVSTMFLRYHYLVDIVAALALTLVFFFAGRPLIRFYQHLRAREGLSFLL
jgi:hypothetical protein